MDRVLVTGARGFIGRHCLRPLVGAGHEVHAVTRGSPTVLTDDVIWHKGNLLDSDDRERLLSEVEPSHLLHLAWCTDPDSYLSSRENLEWVSASLHLLERFEDQGGTRATLVGTCYEYDLDAGFLSESQTPLAPRSLYGTSKAGLRSISERFAEEADLSLAWPRIFLLYGPHERPGRLVSSVTASLLKGETAECSHGRQIRDFLHVDDVGDAIASIVASDIEGPINVASGKPVTVREVVEEIADTVGRPELVEFGAIETRPDEPKMIVGDVSRLREEVGWAPSHSLKGGISKTVEWWEQQLRQKGELQ